MSWHSKQLFSWLSLRTVIIYSLIIFISSFMGNLWMTRNQLSGATPDVVSTDLDGHLLKLDFDRLDDVADKSTPSITTDSDLSVKPRLIYFFAEWCPICKLQHSAISSISDDYEVLGVAMLSGDDATVRQYVTSQQIDFNVINDDTGNISRSFSVDGVPAAFVLDKKGQIKFSTRGYSTEAGLRSRIWLADNSN